MEIVGLLDDDDDDDDEEEEDRGRRTEVEGARSC